MTIYDDAIVRLTARLSSDYANGGHRTYFTPDLVAVATVGAGIGTAATGAADSARAAAAALAAAQAITGAAQGVGTEPLDVPLVGALGSAAFADLGFLLGISVLLGAANYQMVPGDWTRLIVATSGTLTHTLPLAANLPAGWCVTIKNRSGNALTIARTGADTIDAGVTSISIATGSLGVTLVKTGATTWESF